MSFTKSWDESTPQGTDPHSVVDDKIREFKYAIRERLAVDHDFRDNESGVSTIGYHKAIHMVDQTSDPSDNETLYNKSGELYFKDSSGNVVQITDGGAVNGVPSGVIAMWSGTLANIPSGWVLCDGNNSTPNLLDKFVKCVPDASTDPGSTGGASTHDHGGSTGGHTLTENEIPSHKHYGLGMPDTPGSWYYGYQGSGDKFSTQYKTTNGYLFGTSSTGGGQAHSHTISSASSLPPYYEVAFIMKS